MSKFAWVEDGRIRDLTGKDPTTIFHPDVAVLYNQVVPNAAKQGDSWDGIALTPAIVVPPVTPPSVAISPKLSITEFNFLFTVEERLAIQANTDVSLLNFRQLLDDPRCLEVDLAKDYMKDYVNYLKVLLLITPSRKLKILAGRFPNDPAL
jgi:hypothetical protein